MIDLSNFFYFVSNKRKGEVRGNIDCGSITSLILLLI
jgi:hypothetical protein